MPVLQWLWDTVTFCLPVLQWSWDTATFCMPVFQCMAWSSEISQFWFFLCYFLHLGICTSYL